jgi:hypothetical protein
VQIAQVKNAKAIQAWRKVGQLQSYMADNRVKRIRKTSLVQSGDLQSELQKCGRQAIVPKQEVAVPMCSPALVVARFYRSALRQARFQIVPERRLLRRLLLFVPAHVVVPPSPLEQSSGWPLPTRRGHLNRSLAE